MADNVTADPGAGGAVFATDDIGGVHYPITKAAFGALDTATLVTASVGLPVGDAGGSLTVDGTVTANLAAGTNNIGDVDVLTVPAPLSTTGGGTEAAALRVTLANDSTGLVSIDDNGGSLTVDNPTLSVAGGGVEATALRVTLANDSTGLISIDDNAGSLTVDNPALSVVGGGTEATAQRVTIASDSTGVLSVDDNGGTLTVDNAGTFAVQETGAAYSTHRSIDLDETEEEIKATAGTVYGMWVTNQATTTRWIKFYNATAATVVVGTTTPFLTIGIPGNTSDDVSGNFGPGGLGIAFSTAITVAATTGVADADTGAPAANDVIVNIFYK